MQIRTRQSMPRTKTPLPWLALGVAALVLGACGGGGGAGGDGGDGPGEPADSVAGPTATATAVPSVEQTTGQTSAQNPARITGQSAEPAVGAARGVEPGIGAAAKGEPVAPAARPSAPAARPSPPAAANPAADESVSREAAFRLLDQASFGARLEDIEAVAAIGPAAWIDAQMALPATLMLPALRAHGGDRWNRHVNVWWRLAVQSDDQLRQRVAFALSEIFVVSSAGDLGKHQEGLANYYDILLRNAFGNYRTLLGEITLNPAMGEYLSMKGNLKPDPKAGIRPDENYARELLQLFSIGPVRLGPDGTPRCADAKGVGTDAGSRACGDDEVPLPSYDQAVVEGFAHAFTGWHFANAERFRWARNKDYLSPMRPWQSFHDTGRKRLLDGAFLPPGQSAEQDLSMALDNVFRHPNVGPFLSRQLIQRLVTSNPSPGYVRDVAAVFDRDADGVRGSLGSTVRAILMHREAREGHLLLPRTFGKIKEPLLRVTQLWRAFRPESIGERFHYAWAANELAQAPLVSPTVFNFFRPDFVPPGPLTEAGLVAPEFGIIDETSIITLTGRLLAGSIWSHNYKADTGSSTVVIDIDREMQLEPERDALLDHLDLLLLGGRMPPELRAEAGRLMDARDYPGAASQRVGEAIFLILTSPDAALQF